MASFLSFLSENHIRSREFARDVGPSRRRGPITVVSIRCLLTLVLYDSERVMDVMSLAVYIIPQDRLMSSPTLPSR